MKAVEFPQANATLAKDQPQYDPLPVFVETKTLASPSDTGGEPVLQTIPWQMTCVYELSDEDIRDLTENRRLFYRQYVMGNLFHPIFLSTKDPFVEENKKHWPADL